MQLTRKSIISGIETTRNLPVTEEQLKAFADGEVVQKAFPRLSAADREWIRSGITDKEWKEMYNNDDTIVGSTLPCNFDGNGECLVCDCWPSNCAYLRFLSQDYTWETKEKLDEMFKNFNEKKTLI